MPETLKDISALVQQEDELSLGGHGGASNRMVLKQSELNTLRRMANRIPINNGERERALALTMQVIDGDFTPSHKLTALRVFATFEKLNVEEMKAYIATKIATMPKLDKSTVNVNIDARNVTVEGVLDEYANIIATGDVSAQSTQDDGSGKPVHSPKTNGKAS